MMEKRIDLFGLGIAKSRGDMLVNYASEINLYLMTTYRNELDLGHSGRTSKKRDQLH